jgi:PncC family amidohydrolase
MMDLVQKIRDTANGKIISVAESCTGGMLASYLTSIPGSSAYFTAGIVSYSNEAKMKLLSVSSDSLAKYGAVSEFVAKEMAQGCQKIANSDIAISITGVAGPDGGTKTKPIGMVCFGVITDSDVKTYTHHLKGDREHVRKEACRIALTLILDLLQH